MSHSTESDAELLDRAFHRALARAPTAQEKDSLLKFLTTQRATCKESPEGANKLLHVGLAPVPTEKNPSELAAWTQVCRVILNLHETITCY
jgi:hypothetical protein